MRLFSKTISYIFHPIFTPIFGTLIYFLLTPKYATILEIVSINILPIFILTVVIPIICFYLLKSMGILNSIFISNIKERKYPFFINIALLFIVLLKVIPNNYNPEVFFYFLGLIAAYISSLLLLILNFKSSMHLMSIASLLMFTINLSIHFEINIILLISLLVTLSGLIASARIYLKAHTKSEVIIGFIVGFGTQLLTIKFWL